LRTLNGEQLASEATEQLFDSILLGEVPKLWLKMSYSTERTLPAYITDLRRRISSLEKWMSEGPPPVHWLPGFFSPQAFLTAVLQDHARRHFVEIDRLVLNFEFYNRSAVDTEEPSSDLWR